jgi:hypothetical protein
MMMEEEMVLKMSVILMCQMEREMEHVRRTESE